VPSVIPRCPSVDSLELPINNFPLPYPNLSGFLLHTHPTPLTPSVVCPQFLRRIAALALDAAYCYRRSSVVRLSVCLSVTTVSPAKAAEPIVRDIDSDGPKEPLDWVQIPTREWAILWTKKVRDMPGHVWRSIYSKRLNRGQHRYGADDDLGLLDVVHIVATGRIRLNRPCRVLRRCGLRRNYFDHL